MTPIINILNAYVENVHSFSQSFLLLFSFEWQLMQQSYFSEGLTDCQSINKTPRMDCMFSFSFSCSFSIWNLEGKTNAKVKVAYLRAQ